MSFFGSFFSFLMMVMIMMMVMMMMKVKVKVDNGKVSRDEEKKAKVDDIEKKKTVKIKKYQDEYGANAQENSQWIDIKNIFEMQFHQSKKEKADEKRGLGFGNHAKHREKALGFLLST